MSYIEAQTARPTLEQMNQVLEVGTDMGREQGCLMEGYKPSDAYFFLPKEVDHVLAHDHKYRPTDFLTRRFIGRIGLTNEAHWQVHIGESCLVHHVNKRQTGGYKAWYKLEWSDEQVLLASRTMHQYDPDPEIQDKIHTELLNYAGCERLLRRLADFRGDSQDRAQEGARPVLEALVLEALMVL